MSREPFCTAILARNERDRYLADVLDHHAKFGPIIVLDDGSTDGTAEFCEAHAGVVRVARRPARAAAAWGAETPARQELWRLAQEVADWVLIADADQLLSADPRPLLRSGAADAWAFVLYDVWDLATSLYREDAYWRGHLHHRPWLFRTHRDWDDVGAGRGIHCGHAPGGDWRVACAPADRWYWLHLGYAKAEDRQAKLIRYREQYHQMTPFEQAHAESIADPAPSLKVLPFAKPIRILAGGPVRKRKEVLEAHLASLDWQELPNRVQVDYAFAADYPDPNDPALAYLQTWVEERKGRILVPDQTSAVDFTDEHPISHQWTEGAMNRVGALKTHLMRLCVEGQYDYLWLVDSDLVLDRTTLASLLGANRAVTAAVYWTRWNAGDPHLCAGPQVWLKPPYQLALPHYPETEFRRTLAVDRQLERVGGLGACTLIARSVIEKGVGFGKPPGFPAGGLMDGEDRHFCEWARRLHVDLWADAWPDIFHCYHPTDRDKLPAIAAELGQDHPMRANHGHLVNLRLTNLEDGVGPVNIRCRIGDGTLLPELELAVLEMQRGEDRMVKVHFPATTPQAGGLALAGQTRLILTELLDCKPFGLAPVVRDEFYQTVQGPVQDTTELTAEQHRSIAVVAEVSQ